MGNVFPDTDAEPMIQASALDFLNADDLSGDFVNNGFNAGDEGFGVGFAEGEEEGIKTVRGNWLDAFQREHMEDIAATSGYVTAVNSDEAGLYRMFRNLSP